MKRRNRILLCFCYFCVALCGFAAGLRISVRSALLCTSCVAACAALAWLGIWLQQRKLKALAADMDRLLHGDYRVRFQAYEEGGTAIVANELAKITDTLQTQAESLKKEKIYLADSIADISHQIRTPLTALNLTLETCAQEAGGLSKRENPEEQEARLRTAASLRQAKQLTRRMEWLIEALLKLSKLDAGTIVFARETVSVAQLISQAAEPLRIPMELRAQTLSTDGIAPDAVFCGDAAWSVEAVGNILKNCVEHTGEGGTIRVSAVENAIYTELVISDNGEGIAAEDLPHLFERFYKGKNSGGNSVGIGLALARAIVLQQNGTIRAENESGGGARFTVRIYKSAVQV